MPQLFSRFSLDFPSKTIFPLVISHWQKSKRQRHLRAQSHPSNQSPLPWAFDSFCHSILCLCHVWVKLCAEQLCSFCTSCSPIVCGKLPLQLVISQFDMPPLYLYIIIPFTRIESKIAQWQNQSAKLATTKHIAHLTMEKTHMHGAKESHNLIMKLPNAHSRVAKSLIKQNCFKMHHLTNKSIATLHTLLTSQPLWNEVSIAVRPEWLLDPRTSTRRLKQVNSIYWGEDLETPRSTEASSSSFFHPSCREETNLN